jgi:hypothetical protein
VTLTPTNGPARDRPVSKFSDDERREYGRLDQSMGRWAARARDALELLESKRRPDGTWRAGGRYWRSRGRTQTECIDWGDASDVLTHQAQSVLAAAVPG